MSREAGTRTTTGTRAGTGRKRANGAVFMTGATGFIGRRLLAKLARTGRTVYLATRRASFEKIERQIRAGAAGEPGREGRLVPIEADLGAPGLAIGPGDRERILAEVDEVFHLAAVYELGVGRQEARSANVEGTRAVLDLAASCPRIRKVHLMSTLAVSGDFSGLWREDMLEAGQRFDNHYAESKFEAEKLANAYRDRLPINIYRPGIVVGDSKTGEMDKIDGPYYFFAIARLLRRLPGAVPLPGPGGSACFHVVPVDYVVDAMFHIATGTDRVGSNFSLTDPHPLTAFEFLNRVSEKMGAPRFRLGFPMWIVREYLRIPGVKQAAEAVSKAIGMPYESLFYMSYEVTYDVANTRGALEGSGVSCPRVTEYLDRLIDYFERKMAA